MRELTVDERSLVAGAGRRGISTDGWGNPLDEVVVTDTRPVYDPSWFVADLGGDFGGGGGGDDSPEKPPEEKPKQEHKIDPCKLDVPANHLVPPKTWVKDGKLGLGDISEAWGKALPKMSNDDLRAIKGALEGIRDSLPISSWWELLKPDASDGVEKGATMIHYSALSDMMKAIDRAIALPTEQRGIEGLNIAKGFFTWSESKFFSFLAVKNLFKASCASA